MLLGVLSDDQLARYGEIARDQVAAELERWWLPASLALGAIVALGVTAARLGHADAVVEALGLDAMCAARCVALGLGAALALGYLPYRRARSWSLWRGHLRAVSAEQERRRKTPA